MLSALWGEALGLVSPNHSDCVRELRLTGQRGAITTLVVKCTLPLDVETVIGLQILGDRAVADPNLELTILASLEE